MKPIICTLGVIDFSTNSVLLFKEIILIILIINVVAGIYLFLRSLSPKKKRLDFSSSVSDPRLRTENSFTRRILLPHLNWKYNWDKRKIYERLGIDGLEIMTDWDEVLLKDYFSRVPPENLPYFEGWLRSAVSVSEEIRLVRLIAFFNRRRSIDYLLERLPTKNRELKKELIYALGLLKSKKAEKIFFKIYVESDPGIRLEILKAILRINSGKALSFLLNVFSKSEDKSEKIQILNSIRNYSEEGRMFFEREKKKAGRMQRDIFAHLSDPLLYPKSHETDYAETAAGSESLNPPLLKKILYG